MDKGIIDVVIIVEHLNRELESALLLESELKKRNMLTAIVFKGWNEGPESARLRPKVIVTPWCYDSTDIKSLRAYKGGFNDETFHIVDLHSEQITSPDAMKFVLPTGEACNTVHLCWGDFFRDALLKEGIDSSKIYVVGSNRLDMFREEFRYLSASKDELASAYSLDKSKPWILIVGNYSFAFMSDERIAALESRGLKNARVNADVTKRTFDCVIEWIQSLLEQDYADKAEFIYRPHPSEPISRRLVELESNYSSFHINKEKAIRDWFLNSNIALMWNSTSSVEAAYSDLPILALRPVPIPDFLQFNLLEKIEHITSCEQLIKMVRLAILNELPVLNEEFLSDIGFYYQKREKSATELIADIIENLLLTETGSFSSARKPLYRLRKDAAYFVKEGIYRLGLAKHFQRLRILADDHISVSELQEERRRINSGR